jgi:hypothetical protein
VATEGGIDDRAEAATLILIHPIGMARTGHWSRKPRRPDAECGKKSPGRSEGKRWVMNRLDKASRGKAGWTEAVRWGRQGSGQAPSRRSGENPREAREGSLDWPADGRELKAIIFGRGVFLNGKNFHSIVIVARVHISRFSRVLKKLTVWRAVG